MVNKNNDTITYDFGVQVPGPLVSSISNEYTHDGDMAFIWRCLLTSKYSVGNYNGG